VGQNIIIYLINLYNRYRKKSETWLKFIWKIYSFFYFDLSSS